MYRLTRIFARPKPFPGTVSRPNAGATRSALFEFTHNALANVAARLSALYQWCVCLREERAHCLCASGRHSFAIFSMQMSASENTESWTCCTGLYQHQYVCVRCLCVRRLKRKAPTWLSRKLSRVEKFALCMKMKQRQESTEGRLLVTLASALNK